MTSVVEETARLVHQYRPRGAALKLLTFRGDEVILSGPAGTGKSRAALEKMHLVALRNPDFRGLMVRKTMKSLTESGLVTFRRYVAAESIKARHLKWFGGSLEKPPAWMYARGAEILCGGMDDPGKVMSTEYDIVFVQEATQLALEDWEAIISRLRNGGLSYAQIIADCNPSTPHHWLKKRAQDGLLTMLESRHEDNPLYFDDNGVMTEAGKAYILGKLDRLSGPRKQRLRYGKWVAAEGQIYDNWDDAVHLVDRFKVPKNWPRFWVVDFGYRNPFVLQRWAQDPDGRLWLYAETYMTGRLVEDHARNVLREVTKPTEKWNPGDSEDPLRELQDGRRVWREPQPQAVICDHDAEGRATLEKHLGLPTVPANKDVLTGIEAVQARLRKDDTGRPGLYIMRDSVTQRDQSLVDAAKPTCTAEEIPGYVWKRKSSTVLAMEKPEPEEPVKVDDHGCDAKRYLVVHIDGGTEIQLRTLTW